EPGVGLVHEERDSQRAGGTVGRSADVATTADENVRLHVAEGGLGLADALLPPPRQGETARIHAPRDWDRRERPQAKATLRHDRGFQSLGASQCGDPGVRGQTIHSFGDRERWLDVASGTASCDDHRRCGIGARASRMILPVCAVGHGFLLPPRRVAVLATTASTLRQWFLPVPGVSAIVIRHAIAVRQPLLRATVPVTFAADILPRSARGGLPASHRTAVALSGVATLDAALLPSPIRQRLRQQ